MADPQATLRLLWRGSADRSAGRRPGPRQRLTVDDIVDTAIELADAEGLAAVSMRALAMRAGVGAMSLYTYVDGREQLVELMVDQAMGRTPLPAHPEDLGERLRGVARTIYSEHLRHPWLAEAIGVRPALGPHSTARYEWQLEALEGLGLDDIEMDQAVALLNGFAVNTARARNAQRLAVDQADTAWWETVAPALDELVPAGAFPIAGRVGQSAGETYGAAADPERELAFGLDRIVDGLLGLIAARDGAHGTAR
jgi:AcrR family transcriptional regulator